MLAAFVFLSIFLTAVGRAEVPASLFLKGSPPVALPVSAQSFVDDETQKNKKSFRSNQPFWIQHLEIPLASLEENRLPTLNPEIYRSLVFERRGVKYVRWVLNPEDTRYSDELRKSLSERRIKFSEGQHFIGYLTASRSCLVQDPRSGVVFSVKSSTNETGGTWKDKKETSRAAKAATLMTEYLQENELNQPSEVLRFIPEPLSFGFLPADQGLVIREYSIFNQQRQDRRLVPFFSAVHETEGVRIAEKNQSINPLQFWADHLIVPTGSAIGELIMNYGLSLNSPHPQNFLLEVDSDERPTGKIFLRDLADAAPQADIVEKLVGGQNLLDFYNVLGVTNAANRPIRNSISVAFSAVYNGLNPSWAPWGVNWDQIFLSSVSATIAHIFRGVGEVPRVKVNYPNHDYWTLDADMSGDPAYKKWIAQLGTKKRGHHPLCSSLFMQ